MTSRRQRAHNTFPLSEAEARELETLPIWVKQRLLPHNPNAGTIYQPAQPTMSSMETHGSLRYNLFPDCEKDASPKQRSPNRKRSCSYTNLMSQSIPEERPEAPEAFPVLEEATPRYPSQNIYDDMEILFSDGSGARLTLPKYQSTPNLRRATGMARLVDDLGSSNEATSPTSTWETDISPHKSFFDHGNSDGEEEEQEQKKEVGFRQGTKKMLRKFFFGKSMN
ncbi:hypothetical protein BT63DRAFT_114496 [Microthyrium microscopicum]|uniref:Uncharacterized protein n=1 Tax=Microthyrium microscopicum TaxID=703497 RepID=A0A6A6TZ07_9PEZI|nr:hypothetical protein BT63DRAFT_114496 [Microthyrium microscopicum]